MARVSLNRASKQYGNTSALHDFCLDIESGEFVTLLGPSGCGKSTMLRAIAGLVSIDRGSIAIDERDVTRVPIHRRNIGMVFQNLALFPHMTVSENVDFGLKMRQVPRANRSRAVAEALSLVRLPGFGDRYPHQLSGGQQQRVAIARALVINPGVVLLDEPFAALDRKLREEMQIELRELTRRVGITSVFVTHDQEEALTLSDRIVVMNAGRVEQIGTPDAVYSRPETRFVADFMGARNILETRAIRLNQSDMLLEWQGRMLRARLPQSHHLMADSVVSVALRPELIRIEPARDSAAENTATGRITSRIDQGAYITLAIDTDSPPGKSIVVRQAKAGHALHAPCQPGDTVGLAWNAIDIVILRDNSQDALRSAADSKPSLTPEKLRRMA